MTGTLQGREDFSPGLELVPVIQIVMNVTCAGTVMLNTGSEQKSCVGFRKPFAGNEHRSNVWSTQGQRVWAVLEGSKKGQKWFQWHPHRQGSGPWHPPTALQGLLAA